MRRVCRVRPDVPAIDRTFDYETPDALAAAVRVGTVVRVPLAGRNVRGWIVETDVTAETEALLPIRKVSSAGPPSEVVALCSWIAWRWSGPPAIVLRAASPPRTVDPHLAFGTTRPGPGFTVDLAVWPPAADRRTLVSSRLPVRGSSIVVSPDAARAATFAAELAEQGRHVATFAAAGGEPARARAWATAAGGSCVVVGGRAAMLAPVPDLAAIVVLDDTDEALKEERVPAWSAREVALERARRAGAPLLFATPAPSVEAFTAADTSERAERAAERSGWARIELVDPRDEQPGRQLVGDRLVAAVRAELAAGRRVVCILNRRGRARLLICDECGSVSRCERCGAAVVEGIDTRDPARQLHCERCGTDRPRICADCNATVLRARRLGVRRVRDLLGGLLGGTDVEEIEGGGPESPTAAAVVVGTEAALHRVQPPVGMVAFLDFDQELLAPRYRAAEQALWLLVRASRLVGGRRGRVLVQTRVPNHDVLDAARSADAMRLVVAECRRREELRFPPFAGLAELSGNDEAVAEAAALAGGAGIEVLGPHRGRALLRAPSPELLAEALATVDLDSARARGRLRVDVDPLRV